MKKLVLMAVVAVELMTACSKDDGPTKKCESCTSSLGNTFELCDKGNGTYEYKEGGNIITIDEEALGNLTLKQAVQGFCDSDLPL